MLLRNPNRSRPPLDAFQAVDAADEKRGCGAYCDMHACVFSMFCCRASQVELRFEFFYDDAGKVALGDTWDDARGSLALRVHAFCSSAS